MAINEQGITRRDYVKGTVLGGVAAAGVASALTAGRATADEAESSWLPEAWDAEADIVIVGFGGAGASAALEAGRQGLSVIVLEKSPEELFGGNTSVCVGGLVTVTDLDRAVEFYKFQAGSRVSEEEAAAAAYENTLVYDLIESLDQGDQVHNVVAEGVLSGLYRHHPLADSLDSTQTLGVGRDLWESFRRTIEGEVSDYVTVYAETPATHLVANPATKEVCGVLAEGADGEIAVRAKRAVIMACGGYENNPDMMADYVNAGGMKIWPWGSPYNTGDGIKMVTEVGAKLRHLDSIEWGAPAVKPASEVAGVGVCIGSTQPPYNHAIVVNKYGKRFYNEMRTEGGTPLPNHSKEHIPMLDYDIVNFEYPNLPFYMVFDETRRLDGPIAQKCDEEMVTETWANIKNVLRWSSDNEREIEAGYIIKGETLEELAENAGIDAEGLVETVERWNSMVEAGVDEDFGRTELLSPVSDGPFYCVELELATINTQGGAARNEKHQVVDWDDNPIPRLYSAGEFGSVFGHLYSGGLNCPEAIAGGMAAVGYILDNETEDWMA